MRVQRGPYPRHEPGDLPVPQTAAHHRPPVPGDGHPCALRAGVWYRPRGAGRQRCRGDDRPRRGVHAHARGFPRDPGPQPEKGDGACRRNRDHPVAQPARGRRLQVQSPARRSRGHGRNARDRGESKRASRRRCEGGGGRRGGGGMRIGRARSAPTTHLHDYIGSYVNDLGSVLDMEAIRVAGLRLGVDPLGGSGVAYWGPIAGRHGLNVKVVNDEVDPTFRFMTVDWDGKIRMDCSSPHAMAKLIALKDRFDVAFANDTDNDRHGIVTRSAGLMNPNHYLAASVSYLFSDRPEWPERAAVGKTVVSSSMIDRVAAGLGRRLVEVPVGFKWFVEGLHDGSLGFGGEESAGASFLRRDGTVWTTDKDGIIMDLLAAEMTARTGKDPGEL